MTPEVEDKPNRSLINFSPLKFDNCSSHTQKKEVVNEVRVANLRD